MKNSINYLIYIILIFYYTSAVQAAKPTAAEMVLAANWINDAFPDNPPFSFIYNGQNSQTFLNNWQLTQSEEIIDADRTRRTFIYFDPVTKLELRCEAITYADFPAVEWLLYFKNSGDSETPLIENADALNTTMNCATGIGQRWNAANDWNSATSLWRYQQGWFSNLAPLDSFDVEAFPGIERWTSGGNAPWIGVNTSSETVIVEGAAVEPGALVMTTRNGYDGGDPGPGSCPALSWTCPADGEYNLAVSIRNIGSGGNGVEWLLYDSDLTIITSGNIDNQGSGTYSLDNAAVDSGKTYYVTFNSRGDTVGDLTQIDFNVSEAGATGDYFLYYSKGSSASASDFEPLKKELAPQQSLYLSPNSGRSSDGVMPFFNVEQTDHSGRVIAVGWTGQWRAEFNRNAGDDLNITAGLERMRLKLLPGEEIRSPRILLVFYETNRLRGNNLLRSLILKHYSPKPGGEIVGPPLCAGNSGVIGFNNTTEANQIEGVETLASHNLPVNTWWLDAGWSEGGFPEGMGSWQPDPDRFPNGMKPVADAAHARGMKFLLWFEPERVMPETRLYIDHPEWLLSPSNLPDDISYQTNWRLLNYGNTEALDWAKNYFSDMIANDGIDIYRQDFNMHPAYYWKSGEAADRQGMNEIRHITGLYEYLDYLLLQNPDLIIDNCASGGRRLDLEMTKRSIPLWRSDHCWDPVSDQCQTYGLSYWLPISGMGVAGNNTDYAFRSAMGPNYVLAYDFSNVATPWNWFEEMFSQLVDIRKFFSSDYYPLTSYSTQDNVWMAYQFNREDSLDGMVVAFRRANSSSAAQTYRLYGLDPAQNYIISNLDSGHSDLYSGGDLMNSGIKIELNAAPSSAILVYRSENASRVEDISQIKSFRLQQNYPNPFNAVTTIHYQLPITADVDLSIYNLIGQKVATLLSGKQTVGRYQVKWNASAFASGVYLYKLTTDKGFTQTKKLILLK